MIVEGSYCRYERQAELSGGVECLWVAFDQEVEVISGMRHGTFTCEIHGVCAGFLLDEPRVVLSRTAVQAFDEVECGYCEGVHIGPDLDHVPLFHDLLQQRDGVLQRRGVRRAYLEEQRPRCVVVPCYEWAGHISRVIAAFRYYHHRGALLDHLDVGRHHRETAAGVVVDLYFPDV